MSATGLVISSVLLYLFVYRQSLERGPVVHLESEKVLGKDYTAYCLLLNFPFCKTGPGVSVFINLMKELSSSMGSGDFRMPLFPGIALSREKNLL